jgi:hypothetical protein
MSTRFGVETTRHEALIRFAQMMNERGRSSEEERQQALLDAQAEGVSTFDYLRASLFLKITRGNAPLVVNWFGDFELGDVHDNSEALKVSLYRIDHGEAARGLMWLCLLGEHIVRSTETKSSRHLLPVIERTLVNNMQAER